MITIPRLPEPQILVKNKDGWRRVYLERRAKNPTERPSAKQYGHAEIRTTLRAMSFHKCYYCEGKLGENEDEVEHYVEVAERPELAFDWYNLCLSCTECNRRKRPNTQIPAADCLHPCGSAENPSDHLTFDNEFICPRAGSPRGARTIQKYCLDRDELDHRRVKQLQHLERLLRELQTLRLREGYRPLAEGEKELIANFCQSDHTYSLMFSVYLAGLDL